MLNHEVILLETLCFDFAIEHPHTKLLEITKLLEMESKIQGGTHLTIGNTDCLIVPSKLVRIAWMLLYQR